MEIYIILGIFVIIASIIIFLFYSRKETKKEIIKKKEVVLLEKNDISNFPDIQIIENAALIPLEKNKIIDSKVKSAISMLDNSIAKTTIVGKNLGTASKALSNNRAFFSTTRKGTENMMKVKGSNELYGTQMINGKFSKNTKFLNEDKMMANMGKDALVNAGFSAASMVVGQYYMSEVNDKLENIQHDVNEIANFLDTQFQAKLLYIISKIEEVLENRNDILNNHFSRDKRYDEISRIEENCVELLTQANASIVKNLKDDLDYKNYEKNIKDIQMWSVRQQILMRLLEEIGNLRYILANGNETSKSAHSQYNKYLIHTNKVNKQLDSWHKTYCEKFGISRAEHRRKANFFEIRKKTIGKINEKWAYNKLDESIETMIDDQMNIKELLPYSKDKQDKNIKILKKNGEYYNLSEGSQ